jgi:hypothetical protein
MQMSAPPAPVEQLKYTITASGNSGTLEIAWENHVAKVPLALK